MHRSLSPRRVRVLLPLASLCSLLLASLVSFAADAPSKASVNVRLAINLSPISALPLIAQERGLFAQHGLQVAITNFTTGRQALETVIGGAADIATAAESPVTAAPLPSRRSRCSRAWSTPSSRRW